MSDPASCFPESVLGCPRCGTGLTVDTAIACRACQLTFPAPGGVPLLFAEPDFALAEWRGRFQRVVGENRAMGERLDATLATDSLNKLARQRLERQRAALELQRETLANVLEPIGVSAPGPSLPTSLALRTRIPPDQGLNTYLPNVFRDYAWGDAENRESLDLVAAAIGDVRGSRLLVLGAGGGRLAIDLHDRLRPEQTVALDFNPLLTLLAARLAGGETFCMPEFPIAPRRLEDHARTRTLSVPEGYREGLTFVTGDALRAPFVANAFDVVVTPWLADIVAEDFALFARRLNGHVRTGGLWVNFGSLTFRAADPLRCYSYEEALAAVKQAGFAAPDVTECEIDYLRSPASRHARRETTVTFAARKLSDEPPPPRYRALPDWIVTGKSPVPLSREFEAQAASTRIHAFIMSMIDGKRSLADMAALMAQQQLMPEDEALESLRGFVTRMFDDANRYSGY